MSNPVALDGGGKFVQAEDLGDGGPHAGAGRLCVAVRVVEHNLEMSVTDNGQGVAVTDVERVFFGARSRVHALALLRRRLQGLFGRAFRLEVRSHEGQGTTVTVRMPLRTRLGTAEEPGKALTLAPGKPLFR